MATPSRRLLGLGAILCAAFLACAWIPGPVGAPAFLISLGIAAVAYLFAVRELSRTPKYPRHVVLICLLMAAAWRIPFLLAPPGPQDDVFRYVWDGRIQRLGYNPYAAIPDDPALARLHTKETREMNNPDVPSPYPAGAQLFFRAVTAIHESAFAFKVAFAGCDLAIVLLLMDELRRVGRREHWVLAYAWHPLPVVCVAYSAHIDILGALLLLISTLALRRGGRTLAAVAFALSVAVKFLPAVLAPLYWRRVRIRDALMAALAFGLLYVPFLGRGQAPVGSVGTYVQRFRFNDPIFAVIERAVHPEAAAALAVLAGVLTAVWLRRKRAIGTPDAWAWPMAASLACAPVVYPWYLLWLLPFLVPLTAVPLLTWTLSILSVFFVWYSHTLGGPWRVPRSILLVEYGSVAAAATFAWLFRRSSRKL
jgi:alpha-1,6-mannosyltransferase